MSQKLSAIWVHVLQLAILLVGHNKIHMVYSSPTIMVQVWSWESISVMSFVP